MQRSLPELLPALRAVAEPTRLRMLAVLSRGELSVTELTQVLGQSQPRVSRHLKLLGDSGLLERFREQHWIYYRVPADTEGGRLARRVLELADPDDPVLLDDRRRVAALLEERASPASGARAARDGSWSVDDDVGFAVAAELGERGHDALLYFGIEPGEVLGRIAGRARRVVGMHASRLEVQRARARLHSQGLSHCVLQQGVLASLPQASGSFDVVLVDRVLHALPKPAEALREAARVLKPGGRLLLLEDYEALERHGGDVHPLARLRDWLADAGLTCARLRPLDAGAQHLLLAAATSDREAAAA